jgi:hypothetical protein
VAFCDGEKARGQARDPKAVEFCKLQRGMNVLRSMALAEQAALVLLAASLRVMADAAGDASGDALAIMKKVAANTEAATKARRQYIYRQEVRASLVRNDGQVARKETREYSVVPQQTTADKTLFSFSGEYRDGKRLVAYSQPGQKDKGSEPDREVISGSVCGHLGAGLLLQAKIRFTTVRLMKFPPRGSPVIAESWEGVLLAAI